MNILHIDTSITGPASVSRTLSADLVAAQRQLYPDADVAVRDLALHPIQHLSANHLRALQGDVPDDPALRDDIAAGAEILDEFLAADIVVVGAPMYNFSIPTQLKAWIDRLAVPGATFRYTENGPVGLAGGKKIFIASSRGGFYSAGAKAEALDYQEKYLTAVFEFFGIQDIAIVRAEGLSTGEAVRDSAIERALDDIAGLAMAA